ncbi:MAG TPA: hypothetical protein VMS76_11455 [Planctomycetota bacterium]|nr:hypothetical protein [Planctomycetota bacterium]
MSEEGWGTDHLKPQKPPRSVPVWVWACGSGCLLAIVALAVVGFFGFRFAQRSTDPALQWARLREVLPVDEPPPQLHIVGLPTVRGVRVWMLTTADQRMQGMLQYVTEDVEGLRRSLLEAEGAEQDVPVFGKIGMFAAEKGTARVQGRELPYLRFQTFPPGSEPEPEPDRAEEREGRPGILEEIRSAAHGTSMHVDLHPESTDHGLFLRLTKPRSREPVSEEELIEFLEPFHVGPER